MGRESTREPRASSGEAAALDPLRAQPEGSPLAHLALAACTGSFWGHLSSSFWFGSPPSPTEESFPMRNGRSCRCNWSQSPQDLRTPGRHWSLVSLSSLLPFPLKETAAPGAQERLSQSRSFQLQVDLCLLLLTAGGRVVLCWCPPRWPPTIFGTHTLEVTGSVCQKFKATSDCSHSTQLAKCCPLDMAATDIPDEG